MAPSRAEWQATRSRLNHDEIRNGFALAVARFSNWATGQVEDDLAHRMLCRSLAEWPERRAVALSLLASAPLALSPARRLEEYPLNGLDDESRWLLAKTVDDAWRESSRIEVRLEELRKRVLAVDESVRKLEVIMTAKRSALPPRAESAALVNPLREAIALLAETLSGLAEIPEL